MQPRIAGMFALAVLATAAVILLLPPIAQSPSYHHFADGRAIFGVPNAADVLSNLGFLLAGLAGLVACARREFPERRLYAVFFASAVLVCLGSGYYHLAPDDDRLVWDRLPMTIGFMSLLAAVVAERIDLAWGRRLLAPLSLLGLASVLYWKWSEDQGAGDLRPYALVQFLSFALIVHALLAFRGRPGGARLFWAGIGWYALAKLCEALDRPIFAATGERLSGHTLKHLAAAAGFACVVAIVRARPRRA